MGSMANGRLVGHSRVCWSIVLVDIHLALSRSTSLLSGRNLPSHQQHITSCLLHVSQSATSFTLTNILEAPLAPQTTCTLPLSLLRAQRQMCLAQRSSSVPRLRQTKSNVDDIIISSSCSIKQPRHLHALVPLLIYWSKSRLWCEIAILANVSCTTH
jgi:hypothetical protein